MSCCSRGVLPMSRRHYSGFFFYCCRELLQQHRVRLHINFFVSLLLGCIVTIVWKLQVEHNKLVELDPANAVLVNNPVSKNRNQIQSCMLKNQQGHKMFLRSIAFQDSLQILYVGRVEPQSFMSRCPCTLIEHINSCT